MLNKKTTFQRARGDINVKIKNNEINRFYQSGSAKVFYPKSSQKFKELVLVNTAGGITSGDNFSYDFEIVNKSKIFLTTQTAERAYKGFNEKAKIKISLTVDETSAESLDSTRVGIVYCNNLYMVDNVWHLRRSPSYPEHDPKGACGYKPYRVTYKKGDKAYDVGKCKDGRRIYRLFRP